MWDFRIDRGGAFTDIVARDPSRALHRAKLLSEGPDRRDAARAGIRRFLGLGPDGPIPAARVRSVRMGTAVAANALLERKGEPVVLVTTQDLGQRSRLACQVRPKPLARPIVPAEGLCARVIEARERVRADGTVAVPLDGAHLAAALGRARAEGLTACAIVFVHGCRHRAHEAEAARIAREAGLGQISVSHEVSPLTKMASRGDTTKGGFARDRRLRGGGGGGRLRRCPKRPPSSPSPIAPSATGSCAPAGWRRSCCRPSGPTSAG